MSKLYGVLIDTTSIQQYVFGSNKLSENLGASFLVQDIYKSTLDSCEKKCDVDGFIGGGNALFFFKERDKAVDFVKEWTEKLLVEAPGLTTAVAISVDEDFIDEDKLNDKELFGKFKKSIFYKLMENKNSINSQVILNSHGITADCRNTGLSMEEWLNDHEDSGYYSAVSASKQRAVDKALNKLNDEFPLMGSAKKLSATEKSEFKFTNELEKLGSSENQDSHIAIVHIDGNGMGERFQNCKTLDEITKLSNSVEKATKDSFNNLLCHIISHYDRIADEIDIKDKIIPIRPIIIGGDDITFVCDGRLGIYFAQKFLEFFETQIVSDGNKLTACAGIAITKLKYPFYRGYKLAEELCRNAKIQRKKWIDSKKENTEWSYLDFHIAYGGISDELKNIREKQFKVTQGSLLMRPYNVTTKESKVSFEKFIENSKTIINNLPNSKLKEMREILNMGSESTKRFYQELKNRDKSLIITGCEDLFEDSHFDPEKKVTPYFDIIELSELYPKFILKPEVSKCVSI
ncbi:MAG: hypothetical protein SGI89_03100 [bacterium]|nr:hypothetical protein [bacterium]